MSVPTSTTSISNPNVNDIHPPLLTWGEPAISTQNSKLDTSTSQSGQLEATTTLSSSSLQASSSKATFYHTKGVSSSSSTNSSHPITRAVIAGSVIGSLAFILVVVLLFAFLRRVEYRKRASNHSSSDDCLGIAPIPHLTSTKSTSSTGTGFSEPITSESLAIPRRLSQSSRNVYEEEIERLRQRIRCMEEEIDLMHGGSPPPSYRSPRRSDISNPFGPSSSLLPPLPSHDISH
ncbi:hypothetical protein IW261DRAFT_1421092 [Armillaria novae-zelandiae]|uniref:Uncharacterized protein n=1 Tax=Armillaria novae-zelandiae TaxID=153914 RepID=A0AA39UCL6_9AGAR|nr:hypothetical protein IW261DRAFT_1421092 [Armillaria novae-zelandiae]